MEKYVDCEYSDYKDVPWYRMDGWAHVMFISGLFLYIPILILSFLLITGDIYIDRKDKKNNECLEKWGVLNKIWAYIVIVGSIILFVIRVYSLLV